VICTTWDIKNDNNNNNNDNVYGAIIMAKVIARVHPVHLMNVDCGHVCLCPSITSRNFSTKVAIMSFLLFYTVLLIRIPPKIWVLASGTLPQIVELWT